MSRNPSADLASILEARIMPRLDRSGDCWEWTGQCTDAGYGLVFVAGKRKRVHRLVWEARNGIIPKGGMICHHCDNPSCANPDHLYLGDAQSNAQDMVSRGRHWGQKNSGRNSEVTRKRSIGNKLTVGEANPSAKLTIEQVIEIRSSSDTTRRLAERFRVSKNTILRVLRRETWNVLSGKLTHCAKGHPFEGENLVASALRKGHLRCKTCTAEASRNSRMRRRDAAMLSAASSAPGGEEGRG